jgi:hypothetical protein
MHNTIRLITTIAFLTLCSAAALAFDPQEALRQREEQKQAEDARREAERIEALRKRSEAELRE